ncbi:MAG: DUF4139 domain-containing protein [Sedimentisphaerales bacterium]|nr:DUF4139 domain-containing protein [Sedimentisphaerales bacterium]
MTRHVNEDQLIQYLFDLAEPADKQAVAAHVEQCPICRAEMQRLKDRYASLDLLAGEMTVSEELLAAVVAESKKPHGGQRWFGMPPVWLGAMAAVLVIGLAILVSQLSEKKTGTELALGPAEKPTSYAFYDETKDSKRSLFSKSNFEEEPPFAPASAIELNVLPSRDSLQLTIYNSADLTLVRETRKLTFKRGWNWLQFMWANTLIDPTSLTLEPLENKDKIEVQQLVYPPRLRELGRWLIHSDIVGQVPVQITYMTSGLSWRAFYMGTLTPEETHVKLSGYVRVDNRSGEDYENAQTRLLVGKVHLLDQIADLARRQYAYGSPIAGAKDESSSLITSWFNWQEDRKSNTGLTDFMVTNGVVTMDSGALAPKEIVKEGLSEYFLYTIEGTETIPHEWGKRLPSFETDRIPVISLYKYDEQRWGDQAIRFVSFTNDTEHELGQTPIPNGQVKIYRNTGDTARLSYVGGTDIKYIPVNEEIELNLGPASQVKVEPVLMDQKTDHYEFDRKNNITGWDEIQTWKLTVTNARRLPIKVEIYRHFETPYWDISNRGQSGEYEKEDLDSVKYTLQLEPESKTEFEYSVTTYHGTRREGRK